jgi:hypothetical protein
MIYPPGQGKSGDYLQQLWREYLEQYADKEGDVEGQTIAAAYHAVKALTAFSRILDRRARYREIIDQRRSLFNEGRIRAGCYTDGLINATFSIYNCFNTLSHQLTESSKEAFALIRQVDDQVHQSIASAEPASRPAIALRACFPLAGLITITMDQRQEMTGAIRHVERRYAAAAKVASSDLEQMLNALYRIVEMIQIFALITEPDLRDRINQIASRFQEEDRTSDPQCKLRNGFCRLFEFLHLLADQVDAMV